MTAPIAHREISRLAPSPTGALHLGNARTFLVNWVLARRSGWGLILRIEDLDTPRVKAGAAEAIIDTLGWLGIDWDPVPVLVQSHDLGAYRDAMRTLAAMGKVYPCALTRREVEAAASAPQEGSHEVRFSAELRPALRPLDFDKVEAREDDAGAGGEGGVNWRFAVEPGDVQFVDRFFGAQSFDVSQVVGDFVVWTKRRQPSYQLAVVVDDHRQGVTQVVRGADLLDSAARQLLLYRALGYAPEPVYTHVPLVLGPDGKRLAKRHGDTRIEHYRALGVPPGAIIALLTRWSAPGSAAAGLLRPSPGGLDASSLPIDLSTIPRHPIIFTPEDDQWLRSQARHA